MALISISVRGNDMTLNSRKIRVFIVLSLAWVIGWAVFVNLAIAGQGYSDEEGLIIFVFGLIPVAILWAIAWILQGKK